MESTERRPVAEDHLPLASAFAKRFSVLNPVRGYSDIFQDACLGLIYAQQNYNPAKGKFSTHASHYMFREVRIGFIRAEGQSSGYRSRFFKPQLSNQRLDMVQVTGVDAPNVLMAREEGESEAEKKVSRLFDVMPGYKNDRNKQIVLAICDGQSHEQVAAAFGIKRQRVSQIYAATIKKLRDAAKQLEMAGA